MQFPNLWNFSRIMRFYLLLMPACSKRICNFFYFPGHVLVVTIYSVIVGQCRTIPVFFDTTLYIIYKTFLPSVSILSNKCQSYEYFSRFRGRGKVVRGLFPKSYSISTSYPPTPPYTRGELITKRFLPCVRGS